MLYEAIAREKDEPRRTFFVLLPYFTTLAGGLASNILFGPFAVAGYLVTGVYALKTCTGFHWPPVWMSDRFDTCSGVLSQKLTGISRVAQRRLRT